MHGSFASGDLVLGTFCESLLVSVFFNPQLSVFLTSFFGALDAGSNDSDSAMISVVSFKSYEREKKGELKITINDRLIDIITLDKDIGLRHVTFTTRDKNGAEKATVSDEREHLNRAFSNLPPEQRKVLELKLQSTFKKNK